MEFSKEEPIESYRVFSLAWPAFIQIYWNKRKRLHKKRVQLPQDWFGTLTWPPFHCFETPIWPPWRHVKTLYTILSLLYMYLIIHLLSQSFSFHFFSFWGGGEGCWFNCSLICLFWAEFLLVLSCFWLYQSRNVNILRLSLILVWFVRYKIITLTCITNEFPFLRT